MKILDFSPSILSSMANIPSQPLFSAVSSKRKGCYCRPTGYKSVHSVKLFAASLSSFRISMFNSHMKIAILQTHMMDTSQQELDSMMKVGSVDCVKRNKKQPRILTLMQIPHIHGKLQTVLAPTCKNIDIWYSWTTSTMFWDEMENDCHFTSCT